MNSEMTSGAGFGFKLPPSEKEALLRYASGIGVKPSRVVREAIKSYINEDGERRVRVQAC